MKIMISLKPQIIFWEVGWGVCVCVCGGGEYQREHTTLKATFVSVTKQEWEGREHASLKQPNHTFPFTFQRNEPGAGEWTDV